jgi:shikimate dehydrogenase
VAELRLGLVGHGIGHSLSPALHVAGLHALGLSGNYRLFDVGHASQAAAVMDLVRSGELDGLNVTTPFKELAARHVDHALVDGPLNTILADRRGDATRLIGRSSDGLGFFAALQGVGIAVPSRLDAGGLRFGLFGAGGAAEAVALALIARGASLVWVRARRIEAADALVARCGQGTALTWFDPRPAAGVELAIHATRLGHGGHAFSDAERAALAPMRAAASAEGVVVVDLVYARPPALTPVELALSPAGVDARGVAVHVGAEMLAAQAAISLGWWTHRPPPFAALRAAIGLRPRASQS